MPLLAVKKKMNDKI